MPYRDFWQDLIDTVYDAINNELNTQEEIDDAISTAFSVFYGFTADISDIPQEFKRRKSEFYDPVGLLRWLARAGIPLSATFIHQHTDGDGDHVYTAYISPTS